MSGEVRARIESLSFSFAENVATLSAFNIDRKAKKVNTLFERADSSTFVASVVNAYYSGVTNTINFPAGTIGPVSILPSTIGLESNP